MNVLISGNYQKNIPDTLRVVKKLTGDGIKVLNSDIKEMLGEKVTEEINSPDAHVICNAGGYVSGIDGCKISGLAASKVPVYLIETITRVSASSPLEEAELHVWFKSLVDLGLIKVGIDEMYKDFGIKLQQK